MRQGWLAAGILIALCGPGMVAAGQSSHLPYTETQPSNAGDSFAPLREKWTRNLHDKLIDASLAQYAADADFRGPDGSILHGTAAIRQLFETITATFDSDLTFSSQRVEVSGDLGFDAGTYRETLKIRATGKLQYASGSYVTIYRSARDGKWLIAEQVWTGAITDAPQLAAALDPHPVVALTFDDLPAAGSLPPGQNRTKIASALAAELLSNRLTGTYGFVNAVKLQNDPDAQQALRTWVDAGMNIGSHTWSHMPLTGNTAEAFEQEIALNEPALLQFAGKRDWHWFRYPFLWEGDTVEKRRAVRAFLKEHGYRTAQVTLDFEDYAWNDTYARCSATSDEAAIAWLRQSYLDTAAEYIQLGREESVIVFGHEIPHVMLLHATAFTTLMLPDLLDMLRRQGFRFAALPQVEQDPAYSQDPDAALKYGGTLPDQFMDSRHLPYPAFKPKPFDKLKSLCK
jgi:peptidoglycan/xylan/chitin deacetylase (PgdA/CDA1 family)